MASQRYELRVVTLLAAIIAITSVGQFGIAALSYYNTSLLPPIATRIITNVMFWTAFVFLFIALNMYRKL